MCVWCIVYLLLTKYRIFDSGNISQQFVLINVIIYHYTLVWLLVIK